MDLILRVFSNLNDSVRQQPWQGGTGPAIFFLEPRSTLKGWLPSRGPFPLLPARQHEFSSETALTVGSSACQGSTSVPCSGASGAGLCRCCYSHSLRGAPQPPPLHAIAQTRSSRHAQARPGWLEKAPGEQPPGPRSTPRPGPCALGAAERAGAGGGGGGARLQAAARRAVPPRVPPRSSASTIGTEWQRRARHGQGVRQPRSRARRWRAGGRAAGRPAGRAGPGRTEATRSEAGRPQVPAGPEGGGAHARRGSREGQPWPSGGRAGGDGRTRGKERP